MCGKAVQQRQVIFANSITPAHEIRHRGMKQHGHYCIPILYRDNALGVINIYVDHRHPKNDIEIDFLLAISHTLAGIIQQKRYETDLQVANRALKTLSACNHYLVHTVNESELLHQVCRTIVTIGGYRMAWVGYHQFDEYKSVLPAAAYGFSDEYLKKAKISWSGRTIKGRGPTGTALRTRKTIIGRNFLTNPKLGPWRKQAMKHGYSSNIAIPLVHGQMLIGVLTIYANQQDAFEKKEVQLLKELANDLAYGIAMIRLKEQNRATEEKLIESYKHLGLINRQTAILVDLNKKSGGQDSTEILHYVLRSLQSVSSAPIVACYNIASDSYLSLVASFGMSIQQKKKMDKLHTNNIPLYDKLITDHVRIQCSERPIIKKMLNGSNRLGYLLLLPLLMHNKTEGALLLGYEDRNALPTQEIEFYTAFAAQTSYVLQNLTLPGIKPRQLNQTDISINL